MRPLPAAVLLALALAAAPAAPGAEGALVTDEILGRPTDVSVTVSALAHADVEAFVEAGTAPGEWPIRTGTVAFPAGAPVEIVLSGLSPDTLYRYRLCWRPAGGAEFLARPDRTFRTCRPPGRPFTFTVQADPHHDEATDPDLYAIALANALADAPDLHFDLGDTFMSEKFAATPEEVDARHRLARAHHALLAHSVPLFLVLGNHEGEQGWALDGTANCLPVWAAAARKTWYPNPAPDGFYSGNDADEEFFGRRENYYAFTWGDALFVALDPYAYTTEKPRPGDDGWGWTLGRAQYDWFRATLETSRARHRFVLIHHLTGGTTTEGRGGAAAAPYYEWGGRNADDTDGFAARRPGWGKPIHQLLVENRVAAVLHGHDHLYAREDLDGIVYQEVPQPGNPHGQTRNAAEYGYFGEVLPSSGHLRVSVSPAAVTVDYVRAHLPGAGVNGEVAHSYALRPDTDGDGSLDGDDFCTVVPGGGGQVAVDLKVTLAGLHEPAGAQGLKASGEFVPAPGGPPLDPGENGVHLRLADGAGEVYDVSVPGGAWEVRGVPGKRRWTWTDHAGDPAAKGMRKVLIREDGTACSFKVQAKDAAFTALPAWPFARLSLTFALGARGADGKASAPAVLGQCTEAETTDPADLKASPPDGPPRTLRWVGDPAPPAASR